MVFFLAWEQSLTWGTGLGDDLKVGLQMFFAWCSLVISTFAVIIQQISFFFWLTSFGTMVLDVMFFVEELRSSRAVATRHDCAKRVLRKGRSEMQWWSGSEFTRRFEWNETKACHTHVSECLAQVTHPLLTSSIFWRWSEGWSADVLCMVLLGDIHLCSDHSADLFFLLVDIFRNDGLGCHVFCGGAQIVSCCGNTPRLC